MKQRWLARHVHYCISGTDAVFLDVHGDNYLSIEVEKLNALGGVVWGLPRAGSPSEGEPRGASGLEEVVADMETCGVLTADPAQGKLAIPTTFAGPTESSAQTPLAITNDESRPRIRAIHMVAFILATLRAAIRLRFCRFESTVRDVATKNSVAGRSRSGSQDSRELIELFARMRTYTYTANESCMFDSLAMLYFLRAFGVHATWVFGVQTGPFAAHCWIQQGRTVLNDTAEHASLFTPILAI